jgi:enoyl-CoA hydratase/carnithine racemase
MGQMQLTISPPIAWITLENRPANALSAALLRQLEGSFEKIEKDAAVRVVILTGSGRFFCAGADIRELADITDADVGTELAARGQAFFNRIERCRKPVLAAINGPCVGGGLELALACHIRLAAEEATFGLPETKLGLIPGFGGTQRLPRIVGRSKAIELILTGDSISADDALKTGLVNKVCPASHVLPQAEAMARLIASRGAAAVRSALQAVDAAFDVPFMEGLAREAELFGRLCTSADKQDAVQAFLEKRQQKLVKSKA